MLTAAWTAQLATARATAMIARRTRVLRRTARKMASKAKESRIAQVVTTALG